MEKMTKKLQLAISVALISLANAGLGLAQYATLVSLDEKPGEFGQRYTFDFDKHVEYSTTYSEDPAAILMYFHQTSIRNVDRELVKDAWGKNIIIEEWMSSPAVLKISIILPDQMQYKVTRNGNAIVVHVQKKLPGEVQAAKLESRKKTQLEQLRALSGNSQISADFRDAEIGNVLRIFARQNNLNIVASDSVQGKVTLTLHEVTLEQALESILRANGFSYIVTNGVILVKPEDMLNRDELATHVFHLKYIDANNLRDAVEELASELGKVKVLTTSFHNRKDVYDVNERQTPDRENRYWVRSSVLLVQDFPERIEMMQKLVASVDIPVPQVVIEAKLLEVTPTKENNVGIDWSKALSFNLYDEMASGESGSRTYSARTGLPNTKGRIAFGTLTTSEFASVLNFLNSNTNTKLISNPRILAMDNEPSDISVGTNFPIPQINRGVGGQGDIVTFSYRDVNIKLRVTPHVTEEDFITMYVNPIIEEITGQVVIDKNTAPITSRREVDTVVKVRNGETIVIGGMIKEREIITIDKVWLLGSMPLLGHFFQNKEHISEQADLMIFITPQIVN